MKKNASGPLKPFPDSMRRYLAWLRRATPIHARDLAAKHEAMARDRYAFLRGSFFRWAETFAATCPRLTQVPTVVAIGDLHVENFGSWRDAEGRLVWGINDFDEAYPLPFTSDLVRLAVSITMAQKTPPLRSHVEQIATHVVDGYRDALAVGGRPFVLADEHLWLRRAALAKLKDPAKFWSKLDRFGPASAIERRVYAPLAVAALPVPYHALRLVHRVAGMGSLGRSRVVAIAEWCGGRVAREAKALVPSSAAWADGRSVRTRSYSASIARAAVRSGDPSLRISGGAIVRRLAPDGSRIELADLPERGDDVRLITAMGFETANVHLGSATAATLRRALRALPVRWLADGVVAMTGLIESDEGAFRG